MHFISWKPCCLRVRNNYGPFLSCILHSLYCRCENFLLRNRKCYMQSTRAMCSPIYQIISSRFIVIHGILLDNHDVTHCQYLRKANASSVITLPSDVFVYNVMSQAVAMLSTQVETCYLPSTSILVNQLFKVNHNWIWPIQDLENN